MAIVKIIDTISDYAKRVANKAGEDDIFFLASALSFNIILAIVPFFLFYTTSFTYLLNASTSAATIEVAAIMDRFLPPRADGSESPITKIIIDIISARGKVGIYSAIGFIWFSTRLFGTLRSVLSQIFDSDQSRGIIGGKLFDMKATVFATAIMIAYTTLSAYLVIATSRGASAIQALGFEGNVIGSFNYAFGRLIAFLFIAILFFGMYKYIPFRKIHWKSAFIASIFSAVAFELARIGFAFYASSFRPGSIYTGTVATVVVAVLWINYAAVVVILGGEVANVHELRRIRKIQRETFEDLPEH